MNQSDRSALLSKWIQRSSESEQDRQERAERMIKAAIDAHPAFAGVKIVTYAKGSYANNTNVRLDSDVDIVVECQECLYYDYFPPTLKPAAASLAPYTGMWTSSVWRQHVIAALVNHFGSTEIDATGAVAIVVKANKNTRPSADVVPSFQYRRFDSSDQQSFHEGSQVFGTNGKVIVNWPDQQLQNGRRKNTATGSRYKSFVRALKNAENYLAQQKLISPKPSYLMECLVWNVPDSVLMEGDLSQGFSLTLAWMFARLTSQYVHAEWAEPNDLKYLFGPDQKWTVDDAKQLIAQTWNLLNP